MVFGNAAPIGCEWDGKFAYCKDEVGKTALLRMGFGMATDAGVRLHPLEAVYLLEKQKITLKKSSKSVSEKAVPASAIFKLKPKGMPSYSDQYLIFKPLRTGGQVVRFSQSTPDLWRVYSRGVGREQDRPQTVLKIILPSWKPTLASIESTLQTARALRLEVAIAYVKGGKPNMVRLSKLPLGVE